MLTGKAFYDSLPRKRNGAGVVFWDEKGRLLLLKPSYKDNWQIPGGVVEKDESPRQAAERETEEETGLVIKVRQLLAVNYEREKSDWDENLQWMFDGGVLTDEQIKSIKIDGQEIIDFKFVEISEIDALTKRELSRRIPLYKKAIETGLAYYLEDWEEV